jgi:hypothetical protein
MRGKIAMIKHPLALQFMMGVCALVSAFFAFVLIAIPLFNDDGVGTITVSLFVLFIAYFIHNDKSLNDKNLSHIYFRQMSIIMMLVGKAVFVFGAARLIGKIHFNSFDFLLPALFIVGVTYRFFDNPFERFLSVTGLLLLILWMLLDSSFNRYYLLLYAIILFGVYFLLPSLKLASLVTLIAFAFMVVMTKLETQLPFITELFGVAIAIYAAKILKSEKASLEIWLCVFALIAVLSIFSTAGIIMSLLIFMMGIELNDKRYSAVGAILIAVFLYFFYYSLETSLLYKAILMSGSGLTLLFGAVYMRVREMHHAR